MTLFVNNVEVTVNKPKKERVSRLHLDININDRDFVDINEII